jgi:hypothetical protein
MASELVLTTLDFSGETSTTTYPGVDLTAGNFTAQSALMDALVAAQQDIQIGLITQDARKASVAQISGVIASPYAQRENKWLVSMTDQVTNRKVTLEVPAPALSFLVPGSDLADLTATEVAAYIAALEAFMQNYGTNDVNVNTIRFVGRNL